MFHKHQSVIFGVLGLVFFICDRILKYLLVEKIWQPNESGIFNYVENTGVAFGLKIFPGVTIIFYSILVIIIVVLSHLFIKSLMRKKIGQTLVLWFILLGAASNLLDRFRYGAVIDYIDFKFWPVFNIADIMIVSGTFLLVIEILRNQKLEIKKI